MWYKRLVFVLIILAMFILVDYIWYKAGGVKMDFALTLITMGGFFTLVYIKDGKDFE